MRARRSSRRFQAHRAQIWTLITNPSDFSWRSQVREAIDDGTSYSETSAQTGYASEYTIVRDEPGVLRDLTIRHVDGTGTRSFNVTPNLDGSTTLEIIESFTFTGPKLIQPLVIQFMKGQRQTYLQDLEKALK